MLLRVLKSLDKVLTADDNPLNPQYLKAKAWPTNTPSMTTEDLRRAFAQRLGLKMLLDINQLKRTIKDGVTKGIWVYYPVRGGDRLRHASRPPRWSRSARTPRCTRPRRPSGSASRSRGETVVDEKCPVCGQFPCVCDDDDDDDDGRSRPGSRWRARRPRPSRPSPTSATTSRSRRLKRLFIRVEGPGKNAATAVRSLGLAIPQMGKAKFTLDQNMVLEFGDGENFKVNFAGSWDRYKRVKTLTDALSQEASNASVKLVLRAEFDTGLDVGGDQFQTIRDVLESLGIGQDRRRGRAREPRRRAMADDGV